MQKQTWFTIQTNRLIAQDVYEITLLGDTDAVTAPGQFVNIALNGHYLRRPISICDWDAQGLKLIYKVVGDGTRTLSSMEKGARLDLLVGLGNGFDVSVPCKTPLLVGGGVGTPPIYGLAKTLLQKGVQPRVLLGFAGAADVFYADEFRALGLDVTVCTADGSLGVQGFVTAALPQIAHDYFFACGPIPMLHALADATENDGQLSFEERMACGFGACMGCTCKTKYGAKRICKDGPVLKKEEVIW